MVCFQELWQRLHLDQDFSTFPIEFWPLSGMPNCEIYRWLHKNNMTTKSLKRCKQPKKPHPVFFYPGFIHDQYVSSKRFWVKDQIPSLILCKYFDKEFHKVHEYSVYFNYLLYYISHGQGFLQGLLILLVI